MGRFNSKSEQVHPLQLGNVLRMGNIHQAGNKSHWLWSRERKAAGAPVWWGRAQGTCVCHECHTEDGLPVWGTQSLAGGNQSQHLGSMCTLGKWNELERKRVAPREGLLEAKRHRDFQDNERDPVDDPKRLSGNERHKQDQSRWSVLSTEPA